MKSFPGGWVARLLLPLPLLLAGLALPGSGAAQPHPDLTTAVDSVAHELVRTGVAAGLAVTVVRGGETLLSKGYGFADLENEVPATDSTVFRIGSVTKQMTAAAVMHLVEEGALSLDDELTDHLPDFPTQGHRVTLRHLLNHTSGIRNYTALGARWFAVQPLELSHDELVALFRDEPFDFEPGAGWSYSNSGYYLLGMVIEAVTGKGYDEFLEETFFRPLALEETRYCWEGPLIPRRARGYAFTPEGFRNAPPLGMSQPGAAGAICSSSRDLAVWDQALREGRVVSEEGYRRMTTPEGLPEEGAPAYGFGLIRSGTGPREAVGHSGGINGFSSHLVYYPEADLTVAILANTPGGAPTRILEVVAASFLPTP